MTWTSASNYITWYTNGSSWGSTPVGQVDPSDQATIVAAIDYLHSHSTTFAPILEDWVANNGDFKIGMALGSSGQWPAFCDLSGNYLAYDMQGIGTVFYINTFGELVQYDPNLAVLHELIHLTMRTGDVADPDGNGVVDNSEMNLANYDFQGDTVKEENALADEMGLTHSKMASYLASWSFATTEGSSILAHFDVGVSYTEGNVIDIARVGGDNVADNIDMSARTDASRDLVFGLSGADTINGGGGVDYLYGGLDGDTINGGVGNDVIYGDDPDRTAATGSGDSLNGDAGDDRIYGGAGADTINGGAGDDRLYGDAGENTIDGGADNDWILVGATDGSNSIAGGTGYDVIKATADNTIIGLRSLSGIEEISADGHSGVSISIAEGVTSVDLSTVTVDPNITRISSNASGCAITGSEIADTIVGDASVDVINGGGGDDTITGGGGDDVINGQADNDALNGGDGNDTLDGGAGDDILHAGAGADTLTVHSGLDQLFGEDGDDTLVASVAYATLTGGAGNDTIDARSVPLTDPYYLSSVTWRQDEGVTVKFGYGDGHDTILYNTLSANFSASDAEHYGNTKSYSGINFIDMRDVPMSDIRIHLSVTAQYTYVSPYDGRLLVSGEAVVTLELMSTGDTLNIGSHKVYFYDWSKATTGTGGPATNQIFNEYPIGFAGDDVTDPAFQNIGSAHLSEIAQARGVIVDSLSGGDSDDQLRGDGSDNMISGGAGNDQISDTGGDDTLSGDSGTDTLSYSPASAGVHVDLSITSAQDTVGAGTDTISAFENITGSNFADALTGDPGANIVIGGGGDDVLNGGGGDDSFQFAGATNGFDTVDGGAGTDELRALANSTIIGLTSISGVESITAGSFTGVWIAGSSGGDTLDFTGVALTGITKIDGGTGNDTITGSAGADTLIGGEGDDSLDGGDGDDLFQIGGAAGGFDAVVGGLGSDAMVATAADTVIGLHLLSGVETISAGGFSGVSVLGSSAGDTLDFSSSTLVGITKIDGGAGDDVITGSGGADTLSGSTGNDTLSSGGGDDVFLYTGTGNGLDAIDGGSGYDTLRALSDNAQIGVRSLAGIEAIDGGAYAGVVIAGSTGANVFDFSNVTLTNISLISSGDGNDTIIGSSANDVIRSGNDDDTIAASGGAGAGGFDSINGGAGVDTLYATADNQVISVSGLSNIEFVTANGHTGVTLSGSDAGDNINLTGATLVAIGSVSGEAGNDAITGTASADTIQGGAGDDTINGGDGDDVFVVNTGDGFDSVTGGLGNDTLTAGADGVVIGLKLLSGVETITAGGHSGVTLSGSTGNDTLDFSVATLTGIAVIDGGAGADAITGTATGDTMMGSAGNDTLSGGAGDDVFQFTGAASGYDAIDGGAGVDEIRALAANTVIGLTSVTGVESITAQAYGGVSIAGSPNGDTLDFSGITLTGITKINSGAGNDMVTGSSASDTILGGSGDDILSGGAGDDSFQYTGTSQGFDAVDGGAGTDEIRALANTTVIGLTSVSGIEAITAGSFTGVTIAGSTAADTLNFAGVALTGIGRIGAGAGNDTVVGSGGADVISGGDGQDTLTGGGGADTFAFDAVSESAVGSMRDLITDFASGSDRIDLRAIDANTTASGDQAFSFIGTSAFSSVAGELRVDTSDPLQTHLAGDVNGDGIADFEIALTGSISLNGSDFYL